MHNFIITRDQNKQRHIKIQSNFAIRDCRGWAKIGLKNSEHPLTQSL